MWVVLLLVAEVYFMLWASLPSLIKRHPKVAGIQAESGDFRLFGILSGEKCFN